MVSCFAVISFLLAAAPAQAQVNLQHLPTHHVRDVVINGEAKLIGALPTAQHMQLAIMLPLRNQTQLTDLLQRLYDPTSPEYRHFLSVAQFTAQFGPTADDYQAVVNWAKSNGLSVGEIPANHMLVPITGTVGQVNAALNITMKAYQHPTEKRSFFSPDREPSVSLRCAPVAHRRPRQLFASASRHPFKKYGIVGFLQCQCWLRSF